MEQEVQESKADVHADLVVRARRWLLRPRANRGSCTLVLTELSAGGAEVPDAIGWWGTLSYLVECKASIEDWRRDAKKQFRGVVGAGLGVFRYYLVPEGLIEPQQVMEPWGLLYAGKAGVRVVQEAKPQAENAAAVIAVLLSTMRRLRYERDGHVSCRLYKFPTRNTATVSIIAPELPC